MGDPEPIAAVPLTFRGAARGSRLRTAALGRAVTGLIAAAAVVHLCQGVGTGWVPGLGGGHELWRTSCRPATRPALRAELRGPRHPADRSTFAEFSIGQIVRGRVHVKNERGVMADVGKDKLALVRGPTKECSSLLEYDEELDFVVEQIDLDGDNLIIALPDMEEHVAGRTGSKVELEDLPVGATVQGRVCRINHYGIWVDINSVGEPRLPKRKRYRFRLGDIVDVRLDKVDLKERLIYGSLPEEPPPRTTTEHDPIDAAWAEARPKRGIFGQFEEGQTVRGRVCVKNKRGVMADIGAKKLAYVIGPTKECAQLLEYEEELDFVVERNDHEREVIFITLPDMEEHVYGREPSMMPLEDLQIGAIVEGHVTALRGSCIWVDIGSVETPMVDVGCGLRGRPRLGNKVQVRLDQIDIDQGKIDASLVDATEAT